MTPSPLARIRARTARRKAGGLIPVYPVAGTPAPAVTPARTPLPLSPCVNEGNVLQQCPSCSGEGKHVRECELHGECTRKYVSPKVKSCDRCPDYSPDPDPRHF